MASDVDVDAGLDKVREGQGEGLPGDGTAGPLLARRLGVAPPLVGPNVGELPLRRAGRLVEADQRSFQTYSSGVLMSSQCGTNLDHAVLAVGYGNENGTDYWLVKNSWNTWWGDAGYIKLEMDSGNGACGVQMGPSYPTTN